MEVGFDEGRYLELQRNGVEERLTGVSRLFLEVGGHLFMDLHASRVLPGFDPKGKLRILQGLMCSKTVVICCHAKVLLQNACMMNSGKNAQDTAVDLCADLMAASLGSVSNFVITRCEMETQRAALELFRQRMRASHPSIAVHFHEAIPGYPQPEAAIKGFERNSRLVLEPDVKLVIVTGVQANAGKLGTCLSELFFDKTALYSKIELFPIWNLPVGHPINRAYEAATADIMDIVCEDPFYGEPATNYNRDVDAFPILRALMEKILGASNPVLDRYYRSPTSMGLNYAGFCITNEAVCVEAAIAEIARRSLQYHGNVSALRRCVDLLLQTAGHRALSVEVEIVDEIMRERPEASAADIAKEVRERIYRGGTKGDLVRYVGAILPAVKLGVRAGFNCGQGLFFVTGSVSSNHTLASRLLLLAAECVDLAEKTCHRVWELEHACDVVFGRTQGLLSHVSAREALFIISQRSGSCNADFVRSLWNSHMHFSSSNDPQDQNPLTTEEASVLRNLGIVVTIL